MKETLIFCFDGTCNDPEDAENYAEDESITNILKLHILFGGDLRSKTKIQIDDGTITTADGLHQRSFYYKGVGTYGGWFRRLFNTMFAAESGDVESILNAAIKNLKEHHQKDSHVLVFGFSRGAALARRFTVVARERSGIESLKINFLGVFDTVAAISGTDLSVETKPASDVVFENGRMSQDVLEAVHLVALDENRIAFQPTLFDYEHDSKRITEVWFPGVHSDVGGSFWFDGLSDLSLEYMIEKVKQGCVGHIRILDPEEVDYDQLNDEGDSQITKDDINIKPLVKGILHEHKRKTTSKTAGITAGITTGLVAGLIAGLVAGLAVGEMTSIIVGIIVGIIAGILVGVLVGVLVGKKIGNKIRKTLHRRDVRIAGNPTGLHPMVHVSVQDRYADVAGYRPSALRGVEYVVVGNCIQPSKKEQKDSDPKSVATGNHMQPSKEEQKNSGLKYVVATDDKQVGKVREGVSELGGE